MSSPRVIKMASVRKLKSIKHNARIHSKKQIRQIADSIARFGFTSPIIVNEHNVVLAGHGRRAASELLGLREIPTIVVTDLSEAERRAYMLADNKLVDNAGWNRPVLAIELDELAPLLTEAGLDIALTGFEPAEIDSLMNDHLDPEQDPADEVAEISSNPVSRTGELWQLGPHRLLCGDARNSKDFQRLLARERAAMVFTDPPYNVRVSSILGRGKIKHREFVEGSGEMSFEEFTAFLTKTLSNAATGTVVSAQRSPPFRITTAK